MREEFSYMDLCMPRKSIIRSNEHYYHLTGRSINKEPFFIPTDEVWEIMLKKLLHLQKEHELRISAFVLMNNHFHLMALTPKEPIDRIMYFFMKDVTRAMQKRCGRINMMFGGRYKGCIIDDSRYLMNVYKYIYRNPVAAGIVNRAEDYSFSTLKKELPITLDQIMPMNIAVGRKLELEWINSSFETQEVESMKWGLGRSKFKYMKTRYMRKPVIPSNG